MSTKHSTENTGPGTELVPVKFSRLTRRGILLGLSASQLVTLGLGVLALVGAFYAGGGMLIAYTAPGLGALGGADLDAHRGPPGRGMDTRGRLVALAHHRRATALPAPDRRTPPGRHARPTRRHGAAA